MDTTPWGYQTADEKADNLRFHQVVLGAAVAAIGVSVIAVASAQWGQGRRMHAVETRATRLSDHVAGLGQTVADLYLAVHYPPSRPATSLPSRREPRMTEFEELPANWDAPARSMQPPHQYVQMSPFFGRTLPSRDVEDGAPTLRGGEDDDVPTLREVRRELAELQARLPPPASPRWNEFATGGRYAVRE